MTRLLLLGGTTEARALAVALAARGVDAVFSYAGRTTAPRAVPVPQRSGGFGGVAGLVAYLRAENITHVIDATHPFAAQMSTHAVRACAEAGLPLAALERPPWCPGPGDDWRSVPDMDAAVAALPAAPTRIFLAIGRQNLAAFAARPEHIYLARLVDPPSAPLPLKHVTVEVSRGPFSEAGDRALLRQHGSELIVAKNAGGEGARAKIDAARALGLPVLMIARPEIPDRVSFGSVPEVLAWLAHGGGAVQSAERGV